VVVVAVVVPLPVAVAEAEEVEEMKGGRVEWGKEEVILLPLA